jgi:hypothetical protein
MRPDKKNLGKNSDKTKKTALQKKPCQGKQPQKKARLNGKSRPPKEAALQL